MKKIKNLALALLLALIGAAPDSVWSGELVFSQLSDNQATYGPSEIWAPAGINSELADDFDLVGTIDRVVANGFVLGAVESQGVNVRFYAYTADGTPGALQQEYFLLSGFNAGAIDVALSPPFIATGKHFLSVQPVANSWYWWSSHSHAALGQAFFFRDRASGQTSWQHGDNVYANSNADLSFSLYGNATGPAQITTLSDSSLARSAYLEIFGTNFGGSGSVLIDGIPAPVADWQSTRIVAYVPEAARFASVPVQVINPSGLTGNAVNLTVTARSASGRVNWRFRMNGPYARVRPAIASDGTVYAIDVFNHLYALAPDGRLKWLVRGAGNKGVAVGPDGTIYVGSESAINAYNPDGTAKWSFVQNPRAFILVGVSVGPDGNIYAVGTEGLGVFSLTPAGALRWSNSELYSRPIVDYGEIVFGPNGGNRQLYFYANNHLRALGLDGSSVFTKPGNIGQPAIGPDGRVHAPFAAYAPGGSSLWSFASPYLGTIFSAADVGSDGVHYFTQSLSHLFALNADGSQRWHLAMTRPVGDPVVDPLNTQLVMGSADTLDHAGFILSASVKDGHELWRVALPPEDPATYNPATGTYGFNQFVDTRARFSANGSTAYLVTATATSNNNTSKSFVYSLNAANGKAGAMMSPLLLLLMD